MHDIAALRDRIDIALRGYSEFAAGCPVTLAAAIRHSLLAPGKRFRPLLVLWAAEACGGDVEAAMPAACAVEMVHTYSLIHDDLPAMDDDDLRRGLPTCHKQYGEAMAILAGDALLARAFEVLAKHVDPPEVAARCCAVLAETAGASQLVGGQADDVSGVLAHGGPEALESIHHRKTGAMILASLQLGGLIARATDEAMEALRQYGWRLGLAFQITDDLLDIRGDEAAVGKRLHKDSQRGKLTFPSLLGVERSAKRAEELVAEACQVLATFGSHGAKLESLARYVLERNH
jgi:geranylgeranyl diphosphate synthase type II